jgi:hypothetical protein
MPSLLGALMERTTPALAPVLVNVKTHTIVCLRCQHEQPMDKFETLDTSPLHTTKQAPIYRSSSCSHLLALHPRLLGEG